MCKYSSERLLASFLLLHVTMMTATAQESFGRGDVTVTSSAAEIIDMTEGINFDYISKDPDCKNCVLTKSVTVPGFKEGANGHFYVTVMSYYSRGVLAKLETAAEFIPLDQVADQ